MWRALHFAVCIRHYRLLWQHYKHKPVAPCCMKSLLASGPVLLNCNRHDKLISTENIKVYNLRTLQQATKIPPFTLCSCTLYSVASSNIKRCPFRLHSMSSVVDYVVVWIMGLRYTHTDSDHCAPPDKKTNKKTTE